MHSLNDKNSRVLSKRTKGAYEMEGESVLKLLKGDEIRYVSISHVALNSFSFGCAYVGFLFIYVVCTYVVEYLAQ